MLNRELDESESARLLALPIDPTNQYFFELYQHLSWKEAHQLWAESRDLVLAEVDYHLGRRQKDMRRLLTFLDSGAYAYEPPTTADLKRAVEIDRKFATVGLGLVDATIATLAERLGVYRILTTDSDFGSVRVGVKWQTPLELAVPLRRGR